MSKQHSVALHVPPIVPHVRGVAALSSVNALRSIVGSFGSQLPPVPPLEEPPLLDDVDPLDDPPLLDEVLPLLLLVEPLLDPPLLLVAPLLLDVEPASADCVFGGFDGGSFWLSPSGSAFFVSCVTPPGSSSTGDCAHAARMAPREPAATRPTSLSEECPEPSDELRMGSHSSL